MLSMLPVALVWRAPLCCRGCWTAVGSRDSILVRDAGTYRQPGQISSTALSHTSCMAGATLPFSPHLRCRQLCPPQEFCRVTWWNTEGTPVPKGCPQHTGITCSWALCPRPGLEPNKSTEERKPSIKLGRAGPPSGSSSFPRPIRMAVGLQVARRGPRF